MKDIEYKIIRSNRKSISLQINPDLSVTLRVPTRMTRHQIKLFLREKEDWIRENMAKMQARQQGAEMVEPLTAEEVENLYRRAAEYIPMRVKAFSSIIGVDYGRITIRAQKTRWGSCSSKGNLNFNCLLMLMPAEVIDYVVVHELCHRKEMNHSKAFWTEVGKVMPDYRVQRKWLKDNGGDIMRRKA